MKISEIETKAGMERTNIRFYEREGLISPIRMENGYREFTEDDLETLLRIKLLRSIHVPLSEIKALIGGEVSLSKILDQQIHVLGDEKEDIGFAQEICLKMKEEESSLFNLDAKKYLDQLDEKTVASGTTYFSLKQDELPQVHSPWRRFLARTLDMSMYSLFVSFIRVVLFHRFITNQSIGATFFDGVLTMLLMLLIEPFLISTFGTTPGKAIFGLRLESHEGGNLSYYDALNRTFGVLRYGMGFQLPIYNIACHIKSYKICNEGGTLPWDELVSYTIKDKKVYRSALYVGANAILFGAIILLILAERIPPNRGELTIAEFVENYQHYEKLLEMEDTKYKLNDHGQFAERPSQNVVYMDMGYYEVPVFWYELSNEQIKKVSFDMAIHDKDESILAYNSQMVLANLALIGAQKEMKLFASDLTEVINAVYDHTLTGFALEKFGIEITSKIVSQGYMDFGNILIPEEKAKEYRYEVSFSVTKP